VVEQFRHYQTSNKPKYLVFGEEFFLVLLLASKSRVCQTAPLNALVREIYQYEMSGRCCPTKLRSSMQTWEGPVEH
jgi:hypothetical protein